LGTVVEFHVHIHPNSVPVAGHSSLPEKPKLPPKRTNPTLVAFVAEASKVAELPDSVAPLEGMTMVVVGAEPDELNGNVQIPRPCVVAIRVPFEFRRTSITCTLGRLEPISVHDVEDPLRAGAVNTPASLATIKPAGLPSF
jgi:hypothetical protein